MPTWDDEATDGFQLLLGPDLNHRDARYLVEQCHVLTERALQGQHSDSRGRGRCGRHLINDN